MAESRPILILCSVDTTRLLLLWSLVMRSMVAERPCSSLIFSSSELSYPLDMLRCRNKLMLSKRVVFSGFTFSQADRHKVNIRYGGINQGPIVGHANHAKKTYFSLGLCTGFEKHRCESLITALESRSALHRV
jgi:hypothetical protein